METDAAAPAVTSSWASPLAAPISRAEVRRFRRAVEAGIPASRSSAWNVLSSITTVTFVAAAMSVIVSAGAFLLLVAVAAAVGQLPGASPAACWLGPVAGAVVVLVGWLECVRLIDVVRRDARFGVRWRRSARLSRFASVNGLDYVPEIRDPRPLGMIFTAGSRRRISDLVAGDEGIGFELGNYQYAGHGHERGLRRFGFIKLELPRRLPHMVLVSRANRRSFGRPNLPWRLPSGPVLEMGASFDRRFTLHCPERYENDARYVFTPKLLTLLVERAADFDVEIVDDRLLLYRSRPLRMTDPPT